jgi:nitroreductase
MTRREFSAALAVAAAIAATGGGAEAQQPAATLLPSPRTAGGMPLMDALKLRRSTRDYSDQPLSPQILSDLLWAANGVNRASDLRTAPYWRHIMVIDIYVAMADGVWLYDPIAHALLPLSKDDIRAKTGEQDFVGVAAVDLIYVAHGERMTDVGSEDRHLFASVDAGFIGQNVYLFCASEGLASSAPASQTAPIRLSNQGRAQ